MKTTDQLIYELHKKRDDRRKEEKTLRDLQAKLIELPPNATEYYSKQLDNVIEYKRYVKTSTENLIKIGEEIEKLEKSVLDNFLNAGLTVGVPVFCAMGGEEYRVNYTIGNTIEISEM